MPQRGKSGSHCHLLLFSALGMSREGAWQTFDGSRAPPHPPGPNEALYMAKSPIEAIFGGAPLPPPKKLYIKIVHPAPDRPVVGFVLSPQLHIVETHYYDQRTRPCTAATGKCHGCDGSNAKRWNAYLAVCQPPTNRVVLLALTPAAVRECPELRKGEECVRGWLVKAFRVGRNVRARMQVELTRRAENASLPPEPPVRDALLNIWGWFTELRAPGRPPDPPEENGTIPV